MIDNLSWQLIIHIFSSLSLIIFGQYYLINTLRTSVPLTLERTVQHYSSSPISAFVFSACITALLQIGNIAILITMAFVEVGIISSSQGIILMLGSSIGMLSDYWSTTPFLESATPLLMLAALIWLIATRGTSLAHGGQLLFSISLMMLGLSLSAEFLAPLHEIMQQSSYFGSWKMDSFAGVLTTTSIGVVIATLFEGSSSIVILASKLLQKNLISLEHGIALILGSHLGGALLPLVIGFLLHNNPAKKVSLAYVITFLSTLTLSILFFNSYLALILSIATYLGVDPSSIKLFSLSYTLFALISIFLWFALKDLLISLVKGIRKRKSDSQIELADLMISLPEYAREFYIECAIHLEEAIRETRYLLDFLMNTIEDNRMIDWRSYKKAKDSLISTVHQAENSLNALGIYSKQPNAAKVSLTLFAKQLTCIESVLGTMYHLERQIIRIGDSLGESGSSQLAILRADYQRALEEIFDTMHKHYHLVEEGALKSEDSENLLLIRLTSYFKNIDTLLRNC